MTPEQIQAYLPCSHPSTTHQWGRWLSDSKRHEEAERANDLQGYLVRKRREKLAWSHANKDKVLATAAGVRARAIAPRAHEYQIPDIALPIQGGSREAEIHRWWQGQSRICGDFARDKIRQQEQPRPLSTRRALQAPPGVSSTSAKRERYISAQSSSTNILEASSVSAEICSRVTLVRPWFTKYPSNHHIPLPLTCSTPTPPPSNRV